MYKKRKTGNKWRTKVCRSCGKSHSGYSGKLDANGVEYVVCEETHKRIDVSEGFILESKGG